MVPLDDPALNYSDYFEAAIAPTRVTFSRPPWDRLGSAHVQPGARLRFVTDAIHVRFSLENTARIVRDDAYMAEGAVLVDDVVHTPFNAGRFRAEPQSITVDISHATPHLRLHELIMPHGAAVDIVGLQLTPGARLLPAPPRPKLLYVAYGDSITQGFRATSVEKSWAFRLAQANGWRLVNLGYGGRQATGTDGSVVAAMKPDIVTVLIGYNNFHHQTPRDDFEREIEATLRNIGPAAVYVITPLWALRGELKDIPLEDYRNLIRAAVARTGAHLIEGEGLTQGGRDIFPDGTHPNDVGHAQMFVSLLQAIPPLAE